MRKMSQEQEQCASALVIVLANGNMVDVLGSDDRQVSLCRSCMLANC